MWLTSCRAGMLGEQRLEVVRICEGDDKLWGPEDVSCAEHDMCTTNPCPCIERAVDPEAAQARLSPAAALVVDIILEAGQRGEFELLQLQLVHPLQHPFRSIEG